MALDVAFKQLHDNVAIPVYGSTGAAGFDLIVHNFKMDLHFNDMLSNRTTLTKDGDELLLAPGARILIGCGFAVKLPRNTQLEVRSRSGKALKEGLVVINQPGTIDEDYTGEVGVIIHNTSNITKVIAKGEKIAQAVLMPYFKANFIAVKELPTTERSSGGFGSTDKKEQAY